MKQWISRILVVLSLLVAFQVQAEEELKQNRFSEEILKEQLEQLKTSEVEAFWSQLREEYGSFLPENQPRSLTDFLLLEESIFSPQFFQGLLKYIFQELWMNGKLLGAIIILTVFSMILEHVQSAFEQNNVSKIAYAITYLVVFILAVHSFSTAMSYAKEAISSMVHFMLALIPLILALLASIGNLTTVTLFHPIIIFLVHSSGVIIYSVVFPLLFFSAILSLVSTFSEQYKVTQLATLFRTVSVGVLGALLSIFITVVSVQGAGSAVVDGVLIKAAKFVTGNFVPVVGKMFTEAADTVVGASLIIKNTLGLAGVVVLIILCLFPALKILAMSFIFQLSSAVLQPLGNSRIITCLQVISKNLLFVFGALITVSLMFFIALTILVAAGNISLMVR